MIDLTGGEVSAIKTCANPECGVQFSPTRHNQKYHDKNCCKLITNKKIMEQYYEKKERKSGKARLCASCGVTKLSRYNETQICQICLVEERKENRASLLAMLGAV